VATRRGHGDDQEWERDPVEESDRLKIDLNRPRAAARARRLNRQRSCRARRPGLRRREPAADLPDQGRGREEADRHPAHHQRAALRDPRPGRTRKLPAQDHVQGAAPGQPVPVADRRDHRRGTRPAPPPARTHNMINLERRSLLGKAQWRGHPAVMFSSGTGVPSSRGRPPAQPRCSVVMPTRPPCPRRRVDATRVAAPETDEVDRSDPARPREPDQPQTAFRGTRRKRRASISSWAPGREMVREHRTVA
jgi:hypothetical protein